MNFLNYDYTISICLLHRHVYVLPCQPIVTVMVYFVYMPCYQEFIIALRERDIPGMNLGENII